MAEATLLRLYDVLEVLYYLSTWKNVAAVPQNSCQDNSQPAAHQL